MVHKGAGNAVVSLILNDHRLGIIKKCLSLFNRQSNPIGLNI